MQLPGLSQGRVRLGVAGLEHPAGPAPAATTLVGALPSSVLVTVTLLPPPAVQQAAGKSVAAVVAAAAGGVAESAAGKGAADVSAAQADTEMPDASPSVDTSVTAVLAQAVLSDCTHLLDLPPTHSWLMPQFPPSQVNPGAAVGRRPHSTLLHIKLSIHARLLASLFITLSTAQLPLSPMLFLEPLFYVNI